MQQLAGSWGLGAAADQHRVVADRLPVPLAVQVDAVALRAEIGRRRHAARVQGDGELVGMAVRAAVRPVLEQRQRLPVERILAAHHREAGVGQHTRLRAGQAAGIGGHGVGAIQQRFLAVSRTAAVDGRQQIPVQRLRPPSRPPSRTAPLPAVRRGTPRRTTMTTPSSRCSPAAVPSGSTSVSGAASMAAKRPGACQPASPARMKAAVVSSAASV